MANSKSLIWLITFIITFFVGTEYAVAGEIDFQDVSVCPDGYDTYIYGTNNSGELVGVCRNGTSYGFYYDGHDVIIIQYPGAEHTLPMDINNLGEIVGYYWEEYSPETITPSHGFIYDGENYITVDHPDALFQTFILGNNDEGQFVGRYDEGGPADLANGFMWDGKNFVTINFPGLPPNPTVLSDINDKGKIVGYKRGPSAGEEYDGFLYDGKTFTSIEAPELVDCGDCRILPMGINNRGQYVGQLWFSDNIATAFYFDGKEHIRIDHPDATAEPGDYGVWTNLQDISNKGHLVGSYLDFDYGRYGFIAIPEEPFPWELFIPAFIKKRKK